jgi:hypothetical protein
MGNRKVAYFNNKPEYIRDCSIKEFHNWFKNRFDEGLTREMEIDIDGEKFTIMYGSDTTLDIIQSNKSRIRAIIELGESQERFFGNMNLELTSYYG